LNLNWGNKSRKIYLSDQLLSRMDTKKGEKPGGEKKINFIERNRLLLAGKKKNSLIEKEKEIPNPSNQLDQPKTFKPIKRPTTAGPSVYKPPPTVSTLTSSRKHKENIRPVSAPITTRQVRKQSAAQKDLLSKMIDRNLHEPLLRIFLSLSSTTLTACRYVCTSWYSYTKLVFWKEIRVRRELENRLEKNWRDTKFHKVELRMGGLACKNACVKNFRECVCKEKLECDMSGNSLVVDFGGDNFYGEYVVGRDGVNIERRKFDMEQFQLSFHLKLDLKLEVSNWLSTPVFIKKKPLKHKIEFDSLTIEKHPADPTYLILQDKYTKEVKHKFQPHTPGFFPKKPIDGLAYCCNRLAVLTGGRVFVFSTTTLARGNNGGALLLVANDHQEKEPVHFMFLNENVLLTVGGCKVTMFDFWRFSWTSAIKDFQT